MSYVSREIHTRHVVAPFLLSVAVSVCIQRAHMCQTPSKRLTDGRTDEKTRLIVRPFVRSFVSLSVVSVTGVHPMGERTAMLHRNL